MIPKIIHYCWIGGTPLPEIAKKCIESWKKCCPDYEIREWNESNYDFTQNVYMKEAYEVKKWGFVSDYARLDIIYRYGGFYLDTDVELLKSLDPFCTEKFYMGCEAREAVNSGLGFGAERGTPLLKEMMDSIYGDRHFICNDGSLDVTPSPRLNTSFLREKGLRLDGDIEKLDCGITIYPAEYFAPKDFKTGQVVLTDKTYSIHHYDASWMEPEDKQVLRIKWAMEKYKGVGKIVTYTSTKLLGLKRHLRMQGLQGTIQYIRDKR